MAETKRKKTARPKKAGARKAPRRAATPALVPAVGVTHSAFDLDDRSIEQALKTGDYAGLLEDYFGPVNYAELRQLAREADTRAVRGGPKVLILNGIMGSKIGVKRNLPPPFGDDVYWFDPLDIAAGQLPRLALPPAAVKPRFESLGVITLAYLKLKLRLRKAGYDADFHAFDWRHSIADLGKELIARLKDIGGDSVNLVAHSMGGLVARWALGNGGKCRRLIMLGTPNFGSFAPVLALRAVYPIVRKIAALDFRHSPEWLSDHVFRTFPGLMQMLPSPDRWHELNLYDLAEWPAGTGGAELKPLKAILDGVRPVQKKLAAAPADGSFFLIAGINQDTVVNVKKDDKGNFVYESTKAGDGTVPLDFALLPGAKTYYVEEGHGSLPNNRLVADAVAELLARGETAVLPTTAPPVRRDAPRVSEEEALRIDPYESRRGGALSQRELRTLLEEVASPEARAERLPEAGAPPAKVVGPLVESPALEGGYRHPFDRIVVGRRRQHRIDLRFALGSITEADARALALGIFRDVAPTGAAGALDRRMSGAITDLSRRRMFSGNVGEIFIMPTGRHPITADLIAFVGLGAFDRFNAEVLQTAAENVIRTFINTRVEEFATVLFGAGSGGSAAAALRNLLTGFFRGLCDADRDHHFRRVIICEKDEQRYIELKQELYRLSSTPLCQDVEITFDEVKLPEPMEPAVVARRAIGRPDPTYLIVRQEEEKKVGGKVRRDIRSSVLTAGAKAAVVTGVKNVAADELESNRRSIAENADADFTAPGAELASLILSEEVRTVLPRHRDRHLVVVHDAPTSSIPWEALALQDADGLWFPAADQGLSHRYAADNLSVAKWLEERLRDDILQLLLVVNPTGDLAGAADEGKALRKLFGTLAGLRLDVLQEAEATRPALLAAFSSGKYDVIHYAGHAFFDKANPERSGILCANGIPLTGADLAGVASLPSLVFFNACESSRVRGAARAAKPKKKPERIERTASFAEAFLRGGVANFIGTYWEVGDEAAEAFAKSFYTDILKGKPLGEALQNGRKAIRKQDSPDWANYILYGNPDFVLKESLGEAGS
jgi:CHAT domain-containing protein/pimeloyl-ACP methyl ester carboxylesterase